ncbi:Thymidylate kinase [Rosistilla carotiformis]|uniref:Thymidylate kinase n=1 Tax=Rosistilla carotiformis TaxID=2528017 RepID=A0A518JRZ0_9BACT|nr:dTMP kinase [Rosistilla carotiformis]QDV68297.1 Thymidylate kinase [Rosistilla carotiformis]
MFLSIDGIDGAGKTTQLERLCAGLRAAGTDVEFVRDPGSTPAGEAIRGLLLDSDLEMHRRCEALLYMAARAQLVEARIRPAITAGKTVVSDRYLLANVVYQSVGGETEPDQLWELGQIATAGIAPDLTILLDLPAETAALRRRGPADRVERRGVEYMEQVRQAFLKQLPRCQGATAVIDAGQEIDAVWEAIRQAVAATVGQQVL